MCESNRTNWRTFHVKQYRTPTLDAFVRASSTSSAFSGCRPCAESGILISPVNTGVFVSRWYSRRSCLGDVPSSMCSSTDARPKGRSGRALRIWLTQPATSEANVRSSTGMMCLARLVQGLARLSRALKPHASWVVTSAGRAQLAKSIE